MIFHYYSKKQHALFAYAKQRLFRYILRKYNPSTSSIRNFKPLAIFCGCTAGFVSDLVGNSVDRFSHDAAQ